MFVVTVCSTTKTWVSVSKKRNRTSPWNPHGPSNNTGEVFLWWIACSQYCCHKQYHKYFLQKKNHSELYLYPKNKYCQVSSVLPDLRTKESKKRNIKTKQPKTKYFTCFTFEDWMKIYMARLICPIIPLQILKHLASPQSSRFSPL